MVSLRQKRREILKYRYDELMRKALAKAFPDLPEWVPQAPRREKKVRKQASLTIRIALEEKQRLMRMAKECETSLSDLIRNSLSWPPLPEGDVDL